MARSAKALVLAIDVGSSSVRTALFDERGVRIPGSDATAKYTIKYTPDGGAELSPVLLLAATRKCVGKTLRARARSQSITAVAASAFWHSLLGLDRHGEPITPVFTWADSRSTPDAARLRDDLPERQWQLRTGCVLRAPYWPAKLRWLRRTKPRLFRRATTWTSTATWIFRKLFGFGLTSHSMASGTGLYNLRARTWEAELSAQCDVRVAQLGEISDLAVARIEGADAAIFAAIGDGAAGNLGSGAAGPGQIAINIGTSAAVRTVLQGAEKTAMQLPAGLFCYVIDEERFLVGGAISNGGNLRQWCRRELHLRDKAAAEKALSRLAAPQDRLTVLPFWLNERAPSWPDGLLGTITGLMPTTSAADIYRAVTTSVYYRLAQILEAIESTHRIGDIIVSGGVLQSPASLAILADCLGRDIRVCMEQESSLRGAAIYALENLGFAPKPLRLGKLIRHRPALTEQHRVRREKQIALERRLS